MSKLLCDLGYKTIGVDSIDDYYAQSLKNDRIKQLEPLANFTFYNIDISNKEEFDKIFKDNDITIVINLAAQAGVRYSIQNPYKYIDSNISGFLNVLEACRNNNIEHLIFASSSSVYGANSKIPFNPDDRTDHPISLYAATKKANEAMAHSYATLYGIPMTGLRFFTVYGPWGRPDMAYFLFTDSIINEKPMKLFNNGDMMRDFTYVDDIVKTISLLIDKAPVARPELKGKELHTSESFAPYSLYNIGNNKPVNIKEFVSILEELIGKKAIIENAPMQQGDMYETYADIDKLIAKTGHEPSVNIRTGLKEFVDWYKSYYNVN
ncbi:MAG: GDP-mannose 4,6-dehydratase [Chitinophagaceae bacterium]|nr:GDP-mannose 4,6-dehydratase [Chitinophagaceae bacterium]